MSRNLHAICVVGFFPTFNVGLSCDVQLLKKKRGKTVNKPDNSSIYSKEKKKKKTQLDYSSNYSQEKKKKTKQEIKQDYSSNWNKQCYVPTYRCGTYRKTQKTKVLTAFDASILGNKQDTHVIILYIQGIVINKSRIRYRFTFIYKPQRHVNLRSNRSLKNMPKSSPMEDAM
jgi:hypothetical protein